MTWWEILLEVGLISVLIWASYTAGRIDLITKLVAMLNEWAERRNVS
jgi:predicted anti-sigma-YlaC factor YlaD